MRRSNAVGIDVSDSSIKVLQLEGSDTIAAYGAADLPSGVVENGRILNKEVFAETLRSILKQTKPTVLYSENENLRAVLCLPETRLFTHYITIPDGIGKADVRAFVEEDAAKIVPFDMDELYWDYHSVEREGGRHATFVGVPKIDLDNFVEAFSYAKIKPSFVGGELFSLGRALLPPEILTERYLIVDMGAHSTTIGIFGEDSIANVSIVIPKGGSFFTKVIADELEIEIEEAETLKRQFGLIAQKKEKNIREALFPHMMLIADKINEARSYYEKRTGKKIDHIIAAGGSSLIPGIGDFFNEKTQTPVELAEPLRKIKNAEVLGSDTPSILFSTVIGLALQADDHLASIDLLTLYRYQENEARKELLKLQDVHTLSDLHYFLYGLFHLLREFVVLHMDRLTFFKKLNIKLLASFLFLGATLTFLVWVVVKYM